MAEDASTNAESVFSGRPCSLIAICQVPLPIYGEAMIIGPVDSLKFVSSGQVHVQPKFTPIPRQGKFDGTLRWIIMSFLGLTQRNELRRHIIRKEIQQQ